MYTENSSCSVSDSFFLHIYIYTYYILYIIYIYIYIYILCTITVALTAVTILASPLKISCPELFFRLHPPIRLSFSNRGSHRSGRIDEFLECTRRRHSASVTSTGTPRNRRSSLLIFHATVREDTVTARRDPPSRRLNRWPRIDRRPSLGRSHWLNWLIGEGDRLAVAFACGSVRPGAARHREKVLVYWLNNVT